MESSTPVKSGSTSIAPYIMPALYIVAGLFVVYILYTLVKKFKNMFGSDEEEKNAKELNTDVSFAQDAVTTATTKGSPVNQALIKKFGAKPTKDQINSLLPNRGNFGKWVTDILYGAKNTWSPDDSKLVFAIFKLMKSQFEVNNFATVFNIAAKKDMYLWLDDIMWKGELSQLRDIINKKPLI